MRLMPVRAAGEIADIDRAERLRPALRGRAVAGQGDVAGGDEPAIAFGSAARMDGEGWRHQGRPAAGCGAIAVPSDRMEQIKSYIEKGGQVRGGGSALWA